MWWGNRRREKEKRDRGEDRNKEEEEREKERLEREGVLYVGYLGIWPIIAEIEKRRRD